MKMKLKRTKSSDEVNNSYDDNFSERSNASRLSNLTYQEEKLLRDENEKLKRELSLLKSNNENIENFSVNARETTNNKFLSLNPN